MQQQAVGDESEAKLTLEIWRYSGLWRMSKAEATHGTICCVVKRELQQQQPQLMTAVQSLKTN